eukprot:m.233340 g.233340  ORF g.233340 m.233340 type:complete len:470 (-) comp12496_c0_seq1:46-1455(-)
MLRATVLLACVALALAAITQDEVTALPGWDKPLPSKHYSGYLNVTGGFLHYWFIEAEKNPATAPVALWLNGGPGSSSLIGLLTELGQFQVNDDSLNGTGTPTLFYNPYSWNQVANVIFLESPKGVGFSYCTDRAKCVNTDESTAVDAYDALVGFFKGFPEYAKNDFFITGESYAGIYIPMLMDQIDKKGGINLKGAAIGDGCWGNAVGTCAFSTDASRISFHFYSGHAMIPQTLATEIVTACGNFTAPLSVKCDGLLAQMEAVIGNFDIYNIYDDCGDDTFSQQELRRLLANRTVVVDSERQAHRHHPQLARVGGALNDYKCGSENAMDTYLADPAVVAALHVKTGVSGMTYRKTVDDLRPLYLELVQKYRTLIYSGDVDACVPYYGSEEWTRELGLTLKSTWRPWKSGSFDKPTTTNIKAGYVMTYEVPNQSFDFTFLTVNGAGHMVPQHRPVRALAMITSFFNNRPY